MFCQSHPRWRIIVLLGFLLHPPSRTFATPVPIHYDTKLFGVAPVSLDIHPYSTLKTLEPFLHTTATTLANYKPPFDPTSEPNHLALHRANTQSQVNQNGLPWARPPPPGSVDMEALLDERYYQRWEQLLKDGDVKIDPRTNQLRYADGELVADPARLVEGVDMLTMLGKGNVRAKDEDGLTAYDRYMKGEVDVHGQSLWGRPIESHDEAIRKMYGLPSVEEEEEDEKSVTKMGQDEMYQRSR